MKQLLMTVNLSALSVMKEALLNSEQTSEVKKLLTTIELYIEKLSDSNKEE